MAYLEKRKIIVTPRYIIDSKSNLGQINNYYNFSAEEKGEGGHIDDEQQAY